MESTHDLQVLRVSLSLQFRRRIRLTSCETQGRTSLSAAPEAAFLFTQAVGAGADERRNGPVFFQEAMVHNPSVSSYQGSVRNNLSLSR